MAKGVNQETVELAVAIQGNIAGIVGLAGQNALDIDTRKQLIEQTTEAIINSNIIVPKEGGKIPLLQDENARTVGRFAEKIVDEVIKEVSKVTKGVDMTEPAQVTEALMKTSISQAASASGATRFSFGEKAIDAVNNAVKFCEAINGGQERVASTLAAKVTPNHSRENSPSR